LPAEGHLLRLAEPHEIKCLVSLACVLLKPDGLPRKAGIRLLAADALRRTKSYKSLDGFLLRCHKSIMANALGGGETP
ncbi:MAG TPA: hypothetical protein VLL28_14065, partial [Hyphomicrobiaceae bacterium]|nr:hypothetical protein [Hyphomicrobiaceae bacterium]